MQLPIQKRTLFTIFKLVTDKIVNFEISPVLCINATFR